MNSCGEILCVRESTGNETGDSKKTTVKYSEISEYYNNHFLEICNQFLAREF